MGSSLKGFRDFLMRGNLLELAVAFVIAVAFAALLQAFIRDLIMPIIQAIGGKPNLSDLSFSINNANFLWGDFLSALLIFIITAAAIYYFVVLPYQTFQTRRRGPQASTTRDCPYCLSTVPVQASRCPFCTSQLGAAVDATVPS